MKILLTNDDGINSEGIQELYSKLSLHFETYVIAPNQERSACSNIFTVRDELIIKKIDNNKFEVTGYPADCVSLGLHSNLIPEVDIVVSGINHGPNLGDDVHFSGTVAAARTAFIFGKPGIAISVDTFHKPSKYFNEISDFTVGFIHSKHYEGMQYININYPDLPSEEIKGIMYTYLSKRFYIDNYKKLNSSGNEFRMILEGSIETRDDTDSDSDALKKGYISITPLTIDTTDYSAIKSINGRTEQIP